MVLTRGKQDECHIFFFLQKKNASKRVSWRSCSPIPELEPPPSSDLDSLLLSESSLIEKTMDEIVPISTGDSQCIEEDSCNKTEMISNIKELEEDNNVKFIKPSENSQENISPSAPLLNETTQLKNLNLEPLAYSVKKEVAPNEMPQLCSVSLEEAEQLFCGVEIAQLKLISEKEEAIVENDNWTNTDHPLVDLLSTFR